jgi:hypothetical protein
MWLQEISWGGFTFLRSTTCDTCVTSPAFCADVDQQAYPVQGPPATLDVFGSFGGGVRLNRRR